MMNTLASSRRSALATLGGAAVSAAAPTLAAGCEDTFSAFASKRHEPWSIGFKSIEGEVPPIALHVRGRMTLPLPNTT